MSDIVTSWLDWLRPWNWPWWSGNAKEAVPTPQESIQRLKEAEDILTKKQLELETKIDEETKIAKLNASKNKRVAMEALKRKKRYEAELKKLDGSLHNIDLQRVALESATMNGHVLETLQGSKNALQAEHEKMDVDKVHDLMDDIREQQQLAEELEDAIANPLGTGHQFDEDELLDELRDLEEDAPVAATRKPIYDLPVPDEPLPEINVPFDVEDDEPRELEALTS